MKIALQSSTLLIFHISDLGMAPSRAAERRRRLAFLTNAAQIATTSFSTPLFVHKMLLVWFFPVIHFFFFHLYIFFFWNLVIHSKRNFSLPNSLVVLKPKLLPCTHLSTCTHPLFLTKIWHQYFKKSLYCWRWPHNYFRSSGRKMEWARVSALSPVNAWTWRNKTLNT